MKKALVLVSALILLTGCVSGGGGSGGSAGGGGGGGGGAPTPPPIAWEPHPAPLAAGEGPVIATAGDVSKVLSATVNNITVRNAAGTDKTAKLEKTADGIKISYQSDREIMFSADAGDFKDTVGEYVTATKDSAGHYASNPSISYTAKDSILLGGKEIGLQYSDFGLWSSSALMRSDSQGPDEGEIFEGGAGFAMGNTTKAAHFTSGSGTKSFTGTTVAMVHNDSRWNMGFITGTASMDVDLTDPTTSTLGISLRNFADFAIPVAINTSNGAISATGNAVVSNISANSPGAGSLRNSVTDTQVNGQFYGDSATNPSEAAGSYLIQTSGSPTSHPATITGGFGLKQRP